MNHKPEVEHVIEQITALNNHEIKHIQNYIEKKLRTLHTAENSKLTECELDFIKKLMKSH